MAHEKWAGVTSAAVERATGASWAHWLEVLDEAGCAKRSHAEIARHLSSTTDMGDWWAQMVTVGYEQARGLRRPHEKADGFSASVSRTFEVPATRITDAFADARMRSRWLPDVPLEIRTVHAGRSVRAWWRGAGADNGTSVVTATITTKGPRKTSVQVGHERLRTPACVDKSKVLWSGALERLRALLTE